MGLGLKSLQCIHADAFQWVLRELKAAIISETLSSLTSFVLVISVPKMQVKCVHEHVRECVPFVCVHLRTC